GPSAAARDLLLPRECRDRWPHELRIERSGPRPPGRSLCRPHPQGGGARQPAGDARRQVRVRVQSADRTGTEPRRSSNAAGAGRPGDEIAAVLPQCIRAALAKKRTWAAGLRRWPAALLPHSAQPKKSLNSAAFCSEISSEKKCPASSGPPLTL